MIKRLVGLSFFLMVMIAVQGQTATVPCACCGEENKQLDFWIGDWVVYSNGQMVGFNKINKIEGDCVLRENWKSVLSSHSGTSYNFYNKTTRKWRHVWVGNDGVIVDVQGEYKDRKMVMVGDEFVDEKLNRVINRVTWFNNTDGTVRQVWEQSKDGGLAWNVQWDGLYRKRK
jgi:hypothetical protein